MGWREAEGLTPSPHSRPPVFSSTLAPGPHRGVRVEWGGYDARPTMSSFRRSRWRALTPNTRGVWLVIAAMARSAVMNAINKQFGDYGLSAEQIVFLRANVVLTLLLPIVLYTRGPAIATRQVKLHLGRGFLLASAAFCAA